MFKRREIAALVSERAPGAPFFPSLTPEMMTKQELIASAISGKAHIGASSNVTRYDITPEGADEEHVVDYPLIVLTVRNSDDSTIEAESYFTDGVKEEALSPSERETLHQVVKQRMLLASIWSM